ncbi:glycosyltransferase [Neolewinella agarilytica]|uniref:glycosyltransferase n=1 Tax=Neolewinella agarilytica TaxID=478744 RepID=UPI0021CD7B26|nr:glycosyltransferase [Neolewinella agarilytica]
MKTVKYLRDFGWEPVVFTAKDAAYPVIDESLAKDIPEGVQVLKGDIWEPYELYKRFTNRDKKERVYSGFMTGTEKPSFTQKASVWLRGNFFIPDARAFWRRPSVRMLTDWLANNEVDAIISSGPPHTTHLIAKALKRKTGIPWLADFRDPWTNIDFYDQLMLTSWADRKHRNLEQSVIKEADKMITVSWSWADDFRRLGRKDIEVVTNGFDEADFQQHPVSPDPKFTICHIGSLNQDRNSKPLWEVLAGLTTENPAFREALRLRFIGKTDEITFSQLEELGLSQNVERVEYIPHNEITGALARARVLLLLTNDTPNVMGVVPGKLFEYLAAKRPILAIGTTKGDAARILKETSAGTMCGFEDKQAMKACLLDLFNNFEQGEAPQAGDPEAIRNFSRKGATATIARYLNEIAIKK